MAAENDRSAGRGKKRGSVDNKKPNKKIKSGGKFDSKKAKGKKVFHKKDSKERSKRTPFPKQKKFGNKSNSKDVKFSTPKASSNKDTKPSEGDTEDKQDIWKMKKKERKEYRKKHDESYDLIHSLKQHYETLRRNDVAKSQKVKLISDILKLIAGHTHEVIFKHDTGRVMQSCIKFGTPAQKQALFEQFKDDLSDMLKSKYSKFFVKKMLKYGTKEQRNTIIKCFHGKVRKLIRHKEASEIMEAIYTDYAVAAQKASLIQEFYGPEFAVFKTLDNRNLAKILAEQPEKKDEILRNLKEALGPLTDKSVITHNIVHRVLSEYMTFADDNAKSEMIEAIKECVVLILHTHDGSRVAMHCLWNGSTKDRKTILKTFKTYIPKICKEEYGHLVMLSLFDVVDDTVLVKKIIFPEIIANLKDIAQDTYGRKVLLYLLMPRASTHFHPDIVELLKKGDNNQYSKKDPELRRKELLDAISPSLVQLVCDHGEELMMDKGTCQLVMAALSNCTGDVVSAMKAIAKAANKALDASSVDEEDHLVKSASGHFALKRLILQDKDKLEAGKDVFFSRTLLDVLDSGTLLEWCKVNRGAFVVASLLESTVPGVADQAKKQLKPHVNKIKEHTSKGAEIVLKLLSR
ncbi:predicted protein [Nematostella vectensis]|uniref:PUM-HD domain-containing protein n=1 Tax=Nematostella vectensis TaxID=45351 RepID=A7S171_NEMVE|nr:pumilio homolog 3 [Nematostella vectensis]EDO42548.1 predicted protein [Nematostella vectensis]|eukprot:XP_001634611.1 predicted protein [Nematostella vectensis]